MDDGTLEETREGDEKFSALKEQIKHLNKVSENQTNFQHLLERRLDNLGSHYVAVGTFNQSFKVIQELQEKITDLESWREATNYSISKVRERQHDVTRLETSVHELDRTCNKIDMANRKVLEQSE